MAETIAMGKSDEKRECGGAPTVNGNGEGGVARKREGPFARFVCASTFFSVFFPFFFEAVIIAGRFF